MFSSRGTVRYEERGQGYHDVEKVGKHCSTCFGGFLRPSSWAQELYTQQLVCARLTC